MSKHFKPFWKKSLGSIQEPFPHHTTLCLKCGYLYNRIYYYSPKCPYCKASYNNIKKSEFFVGKNKIHFGKNLESLRRILK